MSSRDLNPRDTTVRVTIDLMMDPSDAFEIFVEELATTLEQRSLRFETGPEGRIVRGMQEIGAVVAWDHGERILLRWYPSDWDGAEPTEVAVHVAQEGGSTRLTLEHRGWDRVVGDDADLIGWFAGEIAAPMLQSATPAAFGDWVTDRRARRPSGRSSRSVYRDPLYHYPNFRVLLDELALEPDDYLLEVGCGGGALLKEALQSGCRAAAVDHSPDMVRLAREVNGDAVSEGRLDVHLADAAALPFPDATFTCAVMTGVLGFLPDPVAALAEVRRVLQPSGRFMALGSDPELKGTPAAPEPMASRLRFYTEDELERLGTDAGFEKVTVVRRDLERHAVDVGVPAEALPLFRGSGASFLIARRM